jgi:PAS domain S-box-containing protein
MLQEVRRRERHLEALVDCVPGFVWMVGSDGELRYLNSKVADYTGKTLEELREPHWREVMHPDDVDTFIAAWVKAMRATSPFTIEARWRRADGKFRWFRTTGTPIPDENVMASSWCGVDIDIDESKRLDEALRSTQAQLARAAQTAIAGELVAAMADAINQPLTAIVTNAEACKRWLSKAPRSIVRVVRGVDAIIEGGAAAANSLRRIQHMVSGAGPDDAAMQVNSVLVEVLRLHEAEIRELSIDATLVLGMDLPDIRADATLVQQVVQNLIRNGIDAMMPRPAGERTLEIASRHVEGSIVVEISDSGVGLLDGAPVFEPFYTTKLHGLGLGLAIAKSIVESYGGLIWGRQQPRGASFAFAIPAHPR